VTKKTKRRYRIRNWPQYNKALVARGSLTLWIDQRTIDTWLSTDCPGTRGRPRTYADVAILCSLILREVYHLPLRATQGLASSVMRLLKISLPVPHYSTLSRRARFLELSLASQNKKIKHLVIDATGLKLYGEGEWRVEVHGWARQRTWRKLHISVDADSQQVVAALITNKDVVDPRVLPRLLKHVDHPIERVLADGAYDSRECYRAIYRRGARAVIPPRKGAVLWTDEYLCDRTANLREQHRLGDEGWKRKVKYHRRSLVETAFFRLKTLFSDKLRAREVERQRTEVTIRCMALNRMTELGMPQSVMV
jgi:transposase